MQKNETLPLGEVMRALHSKPFRPHRLFRNGHAQTLAGYMWPRRLKLLKDSRTDEVRFFEVEPGVSLLARCRWQKERREYPTLILIHGLEGSSESIYMLGTARKAFHAGFNVLRLNMRNCGGTSHLTPTLYNGSMSGDFLAVVQELIRKDHLRSIFLAGFSMGGNIVLKLTGECGDAGPDELKGVCAVSPPLDLGACADKIARPSNWLYEQSFVRSLHRRIRDKQKHYPDLYDTNRLRHVRTIRDFDELYTATHGGFKNANDYYARASSLSLIPRIGRPTLIIHAQDDPFIPFIPLSYPLIANNPHIISISSPHGGHVGFISDTAHDEDRFWAENRIVEFCRLIHDAKRR